MTMPRRINIDKQTPAETAISAAIQAVESAGADVLLTEAVTLLGQAQAKVADYVDARIPAPTTDTLWNIGQYDRAASPAPPRAPTEETDA